MISHSKKCLFIHVPKTGGYTIKDVLKEHSPDRIEKGFDCLLGSKLGWRMYPEKGQFDPECGLMHGKVRFYYESYTLDVMSSYRKFSIVRNPWDRLLAYTVWLNGNVFDYEMLKAVIYNPEKNIGPGENVQMGYWKYAGDVCIDTFIRFENFEEGVKTLFSDLDIPVGQDVLLNKKNSTKHAHYSEYYKPEERDCVAQLCKEEIELFGYTFQ